MADFAEKQMMDIDSLIDNLDNQVLILEAKLGINQQAKPDQWSSSLIMRHPLPHLRKAKGLINKQQSHYQSVIAIVNGIAELPASP